MSWASRLTCVRSGRRFTKSKGVPWHGGIVAAGILLLVMPLMASAVTLTVSGSPRQVSTLQQLYPIYACMNPVANGGAGSYSWDFTSNPGNHFTINATSGVVTPVAPLAAGSYPITVRVTDAGSATATLSVTVSVVTTPVIALSTDTIFDNYNGSSWFCSLGILASGFNNSSSGTTWTISDPSNHFGIAQGYNTMTLTSGTPPAGDYPITLSLVQNGNSLGPISVTMHVAPAQAISSITYTQNTVSTSQGAGVVAGTASTSVWESGYQWSIPSSCSDGGTFTILDPNTGVVTLAKVPTSGARTITIKVQDGLNSYSQNFTVNVVAGTTVPAANMSMTVASNLDNYTSSGTVGTPSISGGIPGTKAWSFTGGGVGYRYAINATTGEITVIGVLSYQPTVDGVDYSDVLKITCTDGVNTCTNSFPIPVAACVGPVLNVGPGQTYAHLNDAIAYVHSQGWGRPFAGVTFNVYSSSDPNYYLNDGQFYPVNGNWRVPVTIQGAPGQTFPKFCGGGLYYGKGFFMGYNYDVWVKNVEICNVTTGGTGSSNDNEAAIVKESGCPTGNVFVDNVYIHDCQDGIARGHTYTKWFITNSRISHCGIGETGYTHNIYVQGDLAYFKNILSDQSSIGHVLKSRAKSTILNNCRLYDGLTGHGSCLIDVPEGGVDLITSTVFQKGPNYQNPQALHFADSGDSHCGWPFNQMTISGSTFYGNAWLTGNQIAVRDVSMLGTGDGLPASITMTNNSFYGFTPGNYEMTSANSSGTYGATSVTGSVTLTAQAAQDWSFPGPGPDPTVAHPPGPFLVPYGVVNGAQLTFPVNEIRLDSGSPVGTSVVNPTFLPGQFNCPSPVWSLRKNPGNRYAINSTTGAITTAAALIPGMVDVVEIQVSQSGVNFWQTFTGGGPTYYDHPSDGSFIHSIPIAISGNLPTMYTITPSAGSGGTISPSSAVQVAQGGSQTFTITANSGYLISNVTVDGTSVGAVSTYIFTNVQGNHTIAATFSTGPTYTITASAGVGGTISPSGAVQVTQGSSQTFTITPDTDYTIASVTVDGSLIGTVSSYTFTNVQTTHTISATFNSTLGSVVAIFKSGTGINMTYVTNLDPIFRNAGASNVVQVAADNFEMVNNGSAWWNPNWANAIVGSSDYAYLVKWDLSSIPTGASVIKAQIRLYESSGNQGTVWIGPVTTSNWQTGTVTPAGPNNPPNPTFTWASATGPFGIGDVSGLTAFSQPTAQPNVFDVTANVQAMVSGTAPSYGWAISASSTLSTASTFHYVGYATDTNTDTTLRPALFVCYIPSYTITASAGTGGTITPSGAVQVTAGGSQSFTIAANSGYAIADVTVDGSSVGAVSTYTFNNVTAAHTIAATFNQVYTITASAGTGGSITPSGAVQVVAGASQSFTIAANTGYVISGVTVDGSSVGAVSTYTFTNVQANHTIAATFNQICTITASAGVGGTISPSGAVQVTAGNSQAFTITPNANFTIAGVIVDGSSVGAVSNYTFSNVQTNHTISATFDSTSGSVVKIFKSGAGINMTYVTNLDSAFQAAGDANVVQVAADNFEMVNNGAAWWNPNWANANVGSSDYAYLVKWDLSSIPTGATITKAQIRLYESAGNQGTVWVGPVTTSNWQTGTVTPAGPNNPPNPTYTWASASGPFGIGDVSGLTAFTQPVAQPNVFDVTANVQAMVSGTAPNYGWAISASSNLSTASTFHYVGYATDTNSDTTLRPALFVSYVAAHTITASASTGGTISPSGSVQVASGGSQTFTITPDTGNTIASVTVDGSSVGAVTTYTFSNVAANHTITATFNVIKILKSGAGINMTYVTNLDQAFQAAGSPNVVQVAADNFEMVNNGAAWWNPNWANANVGSSDYAYLVKWDLSSIPTGATITKAQIRLYENAGNQGTVWVGPVTTSNWQTGTVTPAGPNNPPNPTFTWASATGPFGIGDVSGLTAFTQPVAQPNVFDVTANVQAMVGGTAPNYGWAISASSNLSTASTFHYVGYATDTNSDTTLRPALFVSYHN